MINTDAFVSNFAPVSCPRKRKVFADSTAESWSIDFGLNTITEWTRNPFGFLPQRARTAKLQFRIELISWRSCSRKSILTYTRRQFIDEIDSRTSFFQFFSVFLFFGFYSYLGLIFEVLLCYEDRSLISCLDSGPIALKLRTWLFH